MSKLVSLGSLFTYSDTPSLTHEGILVPIDNILIFMLIHIKIYKWILLNAEQLSDWHQGHHAKTLLDRIKSALKEA